MLSWKVSHSDISQTVALEYAEKWQNLSMSSDGSYIKSQYDEDGSYSLQYNLFAHKVLGLNLIPESVSFMRHTNDTDC